MATYRIIDGVFREVCPACKGSGRPQTVSHEKPISAGSTECTACRGSGQHRDNTATVRVVPTLRFVERSQPVVYEIMDPER
jgi:DnaJ-class molecular chaperone